MGLGGGGGGGAVSRGRCLPPPLRVVVLTAVVCLLMPPGVVGQCRDEFDRVLLEYDNLRPPPPPVRVTVSGTVTRVNELDTKTQRFTLNVYFRQHWVDPRLAWGEGGANASAPAPPSSTTASGGCNQAYLTDVPSHLIWKPDTYWATSSDVMADKINAAEEYVHIDPDGLVVWSQRMALHINCAMDFVYYPFDRQECVTRISSYAYTADVVQYMGVVESDLPGLPEETLEYVDNDPENVVFVSAYQLAAPEVRSGNQTINRRVHPTAEITWQFARVHTAFIITSLSQLWFISAISIMGCFVDIASAPARVSIAMLSVLSAINTLTDLRQDLPKVPYLTAMDILYLVTMVGVMANVVEYCILNHLLSLINDREQRIAKLKHWRVKHREIPAPLHSWTASDRKKARAEVRELFKTFDVSRSGSITYNDCRLLVHSAAEERGRKLEPDAVDSLIVASRAPFVLGDVYDIMLESHLAPYIGVCSEPRSAVFLTGEGRNFSILRYAVTRSDIHRMERVYRLWAPLFYVYIHLLWGLYVLTFGNLGLTLGIGIPVLALFIKLFCLNLFCRSRGAADAPRDQVGSPKLFAPEDMSGEYIAPKYQLMSPMELGTVRANAPPSPRGERTPSRRGSDRDSPRDADREREKEVCLRETTGVDAVSLLGSDTAFRAEAQGHGVTNQTRGGGDPMLLSPRSPGRTNPIAAGGGGGGPFSTASDSGPCPTTLLTASATAPQRTGTNSNVSALRTRSPLVDPRGDAPPSPAGYAKGRIALLHSAADDAAYAAL